ncbi:MAG: hypothetical protein C4583_05965, partial [Anaerolineaceae bacterium]
MTETTSSSQPVSRRDFLKLAWSFFGGLAALDELHPKKWTRKKKPSCEKMAQEVPFYGKTLSEG